MAALKVLNGNAAAAEAVGQVHPDVIVGNPVAPAAPIIEKIASFIAEGQLDAEFINTDSAYSCISACIGASAAGGRVFTVSASQGLAAMHENLFIASSMRLPIVAAVTNRALSAPLNIYADHSDAMAQRDCGWIQIFSENSQETYDNLIQAFKIAEHPEVKTPVMVGLDGFITSHEMTNIRLEETNDVSDFVGKCCPAYSLLDSDNPITVGSLNTPDYYFEHKVNQFQGMENARKIIKEIGKEFGDRFSRYYGYFESYKIEDAQYAIILMSSAAGAAKEAVDELRSRGEAVGLLKLRVFRPFPYRELKTALSHLQAIAVLDRVLVPGSFGGPLFNEVRAALYDLEEKNLPMVFPYIYGLGGRDILTLHIHEVFQDMAKNKEKNEIKTGISFINLRQ